LELAQECSFPNPADNTTYSYQTDISAITYARHSLANTLKTVTH